MHFVNTTLSVTIQCMLDVKGIQMGWANFFTITLQFLLLDLSVKSSEYWHLIIALLTLLLMPFTKYWSMLCAWP